AATRSGTIARAVIALLARIDAAVPTDVVDDRAGNCLFKAEVGAAARCDAGAEVDNAGERIRNGEADPGAFIPRGAEGTPRRMKKAVAEAIAVEAEDICRRVQRDRGHSVGGVVLKADERIVGAVERTLRRIDEHTDRPTWVGHQQHGATA